MVKRAFDLIGAALLLVLFSPLIGTIALVVRLGMGSPVLFRQSRPGFAGQPFTVLKFRTMTDQRDANGDLLPDDARLTRSGRVLRRTSLDELPELFNVLKGEMSLVGPRPLLTEYLALYTPEQMRRHDVRPGITGWAQVNGRNAITWHEKFDLDLWYVDHRSMRLDAEILGRTLRQVFRGHGISAPEPFTGEST